jgi:hypothetical protein
MSIITAIGAAGVPGGSIPLLVMVLVMVGVPGEGIALILGVDRILDMARTVPNVTATCSRRGRRPQRGLHAVPATAPDFSSAARSIAAAGLEHSRAAASGDLTRLRPATAPRAWSRRAAGLTRCSAASPAAGHRGAAGMPGSVMARASSTSSSSASAARPLRATCRAVFPS